MNDKLDAMVEKWKKDSALNQAANNPSEEKGGVMNKNQKKVIIVTICVLVGMFLYPPFEATFDDRVYNKGFALIFESPHRRAVVNIVQLMAQEAVAIVAGFGIWFLAKD